MRKRIADTPAFVEFDPFTFVQESPSKRRSLLQSLSAAHAAFVLGHDVSPLTTVDPDTALTADDEYIITRHDQQAYPYPLPFDELDMVVNAPSFPRGITSSIRYLTANLF